MQIANIEGKHKFPAGICEGVKNTDKNISDRNRREAEQEGENRDEEIFIYKSWQDMKEFISDKKGMLLWWSSTLAMKIQTL